MRCTSIVAWDECLTPQKWDYPNITRPFSIIYYALGGSAYYTIDGVEREFQKEHLYILPANKVFSLREDTRDKFYSVYIHAFTSPEMDAVIDIDVHNDGFVADTLALIRRYIKHPEGICLHSLTDMLLSYLSQTAQMAQTQLPEQIRAYIHLHFVEVFKNSDLTDHFNYSRSYLTKVFKEKYNLTPRQYAQQLILRETVHLLRQGMSVAQIADKLEFSSPENLSRFFKGCYGYAPTQYLKHFKDFPA